MAGEIPREDTASDIQTQIVTSQAPQSHISGGEVSQPADEMAAALGKLGAGVDAVAGKFAERQAASDLSRQKVTRDSNGDVKIADPANSLIFGDPGDTYARGIRAGTIAQFSNLMSQEQTELHQKYPNDPAGFKAASDAHLDTFAKQYGDSEVGQAAVREGQQLQTQHLNSITDSAGAQQRDNSKASIQSWISDQQDTLLAMAGKPGAMQLPEFKQANDKLNAARAALATNPLFNTPQDQIDREQQHFHDLLTSTAVVAEVDAKVKKDGKAAAQKELEDSIVNNPDLHLSPIERNTLYRTGMQRTEFLTSEEVAQNEAKKQAANDLVDALRIGPGAKGGIGFEDPLVGQTLLSFKSTNFGEAVQKLNDAVFAQRHLRGLDQLPPGQQTQALGLPGPDPGTSRGYSYEGSAAMHESGGNAGIVNAQGNGGLFQFSPATWATVSSQHPELNLRPEAFHDASPSGVAQQRAAFAAFTADNRAFLQKNGVEPTDKNAFMASFLGAGGAVKFFNAAKPDASQPAANVFPAEAKANPTVFYDQSGAPRSFGQVYALMTKSFSGAATISNMPPSVAGARPFTQADIDAHPYLASDVVRMMAKDETGRIEAARQLGDSVEGAFKNGVAPRAQDVAQVLQAAQQFPDKLGATGERVAGFLQGEGVNRTFSAGGAQSYAGSVVAAANGADIHSINVATAVKEQIDRGQKTFDEHPLATGAQRGWSPAPAPIDLQKPDTIPQAIQQRAAAASMIAAHSGLPPPSIFDKEEAPGLKAALANAPVDQQLALLAPLAALPEQVRAATFKQLGDDKEAKIFSAAGSLQAQGNSQAARDVLQGAFLMKQDPKLAPDEKDRSAATFASLPINSFGDGFRSTVATAAEALYAKKVADAAGAGKVQAGFNPTFWNDAVNTVTGGVVDYRSSKVVVPTPGMSESDFHSVLSSLSDADLANSRTANGTPLPATALRPSMFDRFGSGNFRLQSLADGRYLVFSGQDDARSYLRTDALDARDRGGPFVLDLRGKTAGR